MGGAAQALPTHFVAVEHSDGCCRLCCGPYRAFDLHIMDGEGKLLLNVKRELKIPPHLFCAFPPTSAYPDRSLRLCSACSKHSCMLLHRMLVLQVASSRSAAASLSRRRLRC